MRRQCWLSTHAQTTICGFSNVAPERPIASPDRRHSTRFAAAIRVLRLALRAYDERPVKRGDAMHDLADIGHSSSARAAGSGRRSRFAGSQSISAGRGRPLRNGRPCRRPRTGRAGFPEDQSLDPRTHPSPVRARHARPPPDGRLLRVAAPVRHWGPRWPENVRYQWSQALPRLGRRLDHTEVRARGGRDPAPERVRHRRREGPLGHADWRVTDRHYTPKQITRPDRSSLIEIFARTPNEWSGLVADASQYPLALSGLRSWEDLIYRRNSVLSYSVPRIMIPRLGS